MIKGADKAKNESVANRIEEGRYWQSMMPL